MDNKTNEELDLLDVLISIGEGILKFLRNIVKGFAWFLRIVYKCKIICAVFVALFCVLCFCQNRTKIYRGEADLKVSSFPIQMVKNLLDPLHFQSLYGDTIVLSQKFDLPYDEVSKITDIQVFYYLDVLRDGSPDYVDYDNKWDMKDTTTALYPGKLRIRVDCMDTSLFPKLSEAIVNAISISPQVKKEIALRLQQLDEKIASVDYEISLLDSLRKKEYFERGKDVKFTLDKTVMLNEREMKLYHSDILELGKVKQQLEWDRKIYNFGFVFENELEVNPKPINSWAKTYPTFILIGFLFGVIVSILYTYRQSIKSFFN